MNDTFVMILNMDEVFSSEELMDLAAKNAESDLLLAKEVAKEVASKDVKKEEA